MNFTNNFLKDLSFFSGLGSNPDQLDDYEEERIVYSPERIKSFFNTGKKHANSYIIASTIEDQTQDVDPVLKELGFTLICKKVFNGKDFKYWILKNE